PSAATSGPAPDRAPAKGPPAARASAPGSDALRMPYALSRLKSFRFRIIQAGIRRNGKNRASSRPKPGRKHLLDRPDRLCLAAGRPMRPLGRRPAIDVEMRPAFRLFHEARQEK